MYVRSGDALGFKTFRCPADHPSPPLGFLYFMSCAEYTTKSAGDTRCCKINPLLSAPMPCWPNQRLLLKKTQPCATTLLRGHRYLVENHLCLSLQRKKQGPQRFLCMSQDGGSSQHLPSPLPSLPLRSGTATLKGVMKRSHLAQGGRKENSLAVEGKTATICYSNQESLLGTGQ